MAKEVKEGLIGNIKGADAKITNVTASVDESTGTPAVSVDMGGTESERSFHFSFSGLKGEQGIQGERGMQGEQGVDGKVTTIEINKLTPTYTESESLTTLSSGEALSIAFGKIKKAISSLISHIADTTKHITATERTKWNNAGYTLLKTFVYNTPATRTSVTSSTGERFATQITGVDFGAYDEILFVLNGTISIPASSNATTSYNNIYCYITNEATTDGLMYAGFLQSHNNSAYTLNLSNAQIRMFKANYTEIEMGDKIYIKNRTKSAFNPCYNSSIAFTDELYMGIRLLNANKANYTVTPNLTVSIYGKVIV